VIADARVSREHAEIVFEEESFSWWTLEGRHGTYVNGQRVQRHKLQGNDAMEFGVRENVYAVFQPGSSGSARPGVSRQAARYACHRRQRMEKLTIFWKAAAKLNSAGVLDEILVTLLDTTLKLAPSRRAFVFLYEKDRTLRLAAGRNSQGVPL